MSHAVPLSIQPMSIWLASRIKSHDNRSGCSILGPLRVRPGPLLIPVLEPGQARVSTPPESEHPRKAGSPTNWTGLAEVSSDSASPTSRVHARPDAAGRCRSLQQKRGAVPRPGTHCAVRRFASAVQHPGRAREEITADGESGCCPCEASAESGDSAARQGGTRNLGLGFALPYGVIRACRDRGRQGTTIRSRAR